MRMHKSLAPDREPTSAHPPSFERCKVYPESIHSFPLLCHSYTRSPSVVVPHRRLCTRQVKLSRPLPSSPTSLQLRMLARLRHPISPSEKSIRPRSAYSNVHVNPTYALPEFTRRGSLFRTRRENIASPQIGIFRSLGGSHTKN